MSAEASIWLRYAEEILAVARLSLDGGYLNSCLQNAQQAIEKAIKPIISAKTAINATFFRPQRSVSKPKG